MMPSPQSYDVGGDVQHAVLQDQLGGQHLQDWARNHMAIRHVEPVAQLDRRCADYDFFVLKLFPRQLDHRAVHPHMKPLAGNIALILKSI